MINNMLVRVAEAKITALAFLRKKKLSTIHDFYSSFV
jgi:hypothetical protein